MRRLVKRIADGGRTLILCRHSVVPTFDLNLVDLQISGIAASL